MRQTHVERRARECPHSLFTKRRLTTPNGSLVPTLPPPQTDRLEQIRTFRESNEKNGYRPSLQGLAVCAFKSVQLYHKSQIETSSRLCLRLQQLYAESTPGRLPATDWEALCLIALGKISQGHSATPEPTFAHSKQPPCSFRVKSHDLHNLEQ